jgi:nucleotide-binding universal stress UspA family protein
VRLAARLLPTRLDRALAAGVEAGASPHSRHGAQRPDEVDALRVLLRPICSLDAMGSRALRRHAAFVPLPVIAAIDPITEDAAPAALGLMLARVDWAPLVLASAYPFEPHVGPILPEYARASRTAAEAAVDRVRARLEETAGETDFVSTVVTPSEGSPARVLHDLAQHEEAGTLVIGSSRRGRLGRVLPGAVTDRLLHGAPCRIAVAPNGFSFEDAVTGPRLIGVAFVDTPEGHAALATACRLASRARGLVRVLTVSEPIDPVVSGMLDPPAHDQVRIARRNAAEATLARGLDAVRVGRSAGGEVLFGQPSEALAAASQDLDLLVCGSRGYGPVRTLLLGGTSHALVRKAACPVLVVPPGG